MTCWKRGDLSLTLPEYYSVPLRAQLSEKGHQEHQIKLFSSAATWAGFSHVSYRQNLEIGTCPTQTC